LVQFTHEGVISNYIDNTHYHGDYNSLLLKVFSGQSSNITPNTYEAKLQDLERRAIALDCGQF
jgi:hypothetical protein